MKRFTLPVALSVVYTFSHTTLLSSTHSTPARNEQEAARTLVLLPIKIEHEEETSSSKKHKAEEVRERKPKKLKIAKKMPNTLNISSERQDIFETLGDLTEQFNRGANSLTDGTLFSKLNEISLDQAFSAEARVLAKMKMVDMFLKNPNQQMNANEAEKILTPIFTQHPDKRIKAQAAALLTKVYMLP